MKVLASSTPTIDIYADSGKHNNKKTELMSMTFVRAFGLAYPFGYLILSFMTITDLFIW